MATRNELMASGFAAETARGLGMDAAQSTAPAGTNQATATPLTSPVYNTASTGSGTGVLLPTAVNKPPYYVRNGDGAQALLVYPNGTATINGSTSFSVAATKAATFISDGLNWYANLSA